MRAAAWLMVALYAVGAHADKPKEKKQPKPKKQKEQKKNCPACPADLAGELAAATALLLPLLTDWAAGSSPSTAPSEFPGRYQVQEMP